MRNYLCIILFFVLSLTIPATSAYAYGGGGGSSGGGKGGGGAGVKSTGSETINPPSGFKPVKINQESADSEIKSSSETDPGKEEEVAEMVQEINLMEGTEAGDDKTNAEAGDDKTNVSSSNPYHNIGIHVIEWVKSHPLETWRDAFVNRVILSQCCVDASEDRADDVANHLQSLVDSGELNLGNHTITVGSRSGYKVPLSGYLLGDKENISAHTYTVVQIHDANGKFQGAWEVDTYLVISMVLPHSEVDLTMEYPTHVQTVLPGKKGRK